MSRLQGLGIAPPLKKFTGGVTGGTQGFTGGVTGGVTSVTGDGPGQSQEYL